MMSDWISDFDIACFAFFGNMQSDFLTRAAKLFSVDDTVALIICVCVLAILCLIRRTRRIGFALLFAVLLGYLLTDGIIKPLVGRPRPFVALQDHALFQEWYQDIGAQVTSLFSFPSGHTTAFTAVTTVLLFFHAKSERKAARAVAWIFPIIAFLSGCSRVYLMVHYATDVLVSFVIGAAAGIGGYYLAAVLERKLRGFFAEKN